MAGTRVLDSTSSIALLTATCAGIFAVGYILGQSLSNGVLRQQRRQKSQTVLDSSKHDQRDVDEDDDNDDDESTADLGELKTFPGSTEECKLVLVVRNDLGMGKGKIAAQCSHATLACYKAMIKANPAHPILRQWERLGQAKVALKVDSEDEMLILQAQAISLGLCARVIHDAGRTQIASGSATVLGIGPAPKSKINEVTGHLKLL